MPKPVTEHSLVLLPEKVPFGPHLAALFADPRVLCLERRMVVGADGAVGYPASGALERPWIATGDHVSPLGRDALLSPETVGFDPALAALARTAIVEVHLSRATELFPLAMSLLASEDPGTEMRGPIFRSCLVLLQPEIPGTLTDRAFSHLVGRGDPAEIGSYFTRRPDTRQIGIFHVAAPRSAHERLALGRALARDYAGFRAMADSRWLDGFVSQLELRLPELP